ncbi:MAG TPA: hypothetical protein VG326_20020 [Tepidisphaeraceae bacterium]|jgi:TolB-like protein|nr:hypothetical protein [Tepidisphaeraceae bacterium]
MEKKNKAGIRGLLALALPMLIPAAAMAEPLVLEAQSSTPAATTQPVSAQMPAVDPQLQNEKILVLPFQPVDPGETKPWIGKSIQQSMVADLMAFAPDRVITADQFAVSVEAAIDLGREHGARYVIAGGYLSTEHELRVTGQLLDAQTGKAVTGLKVTGDLSQVFHMEDGLAMQVRARLFPASMEAPPTGGSPQVPTSGSGADMVAVPQPQQSATATAAAIRNEAGVYAAQPTPYYSSYATAPAPVAYGAGPGAYTYYPTPAYDYGDYGYPDYYGYYPYYGGYPYYSDFGVGLGFYYGGVWHGGYGHGYHHDGYYGGHGGYGGHVGGRAITGGVGTYRGGAGYSGGYSSAHSYAAPYRSQPFYSHSSFGRAGGMSAFRGGGFSGHSFGGGGGSFHGGGAGHAGGGGHR